MNKEKAHFPMELVAFFCSMIVVILSAVTLDGEIGKASLIGLIAGSFGAGATLTAAISKRRNRLRKEKAAS